MKTRIEGEISCIGRNVFANGTVWFKEVVINTFDSEIHYHDYGECLLGAGRTTTVRVPITEKEYEELEI